MNKIYKFIAGNSRITPIGVALAVAIALTLRHTLAWWLAPLYLGILLLTLAAATFEAVQ